MRILEKMAALLAVIGFVLRLSLISGGGMLMVTGLMTLCGIYFYLGFALFNGVRVRDMFKRTTYRDISSTSLLGAVLAGFAMSIACVGMLFKLQRWPAADMEVAVGTLLCAVVLIVSAAKRTDNPQLYKRIFSRAVVLASFSTILLCIPKEVLLEVMCRNHPAYVKAQKRVWADPSNHELWDQLNEEAKKAYGY